MLHQRTRLVALHNDPFATCVRLWLEYCNMGCGFYIEKG